MIKKMKSNKYFVLSIIIMLVLIFFSFFGFFKETFSYVKDYNKIKEFCYEEKQPDSEYCKIFKDRKTLENCIISNNPKIRYQSYDVITLTCIITEQTIFYSLQYFSPLIIMIAVLGTIHTEFSSGMFENYLLREDYKKYCKKKYKIAIKSALIMPVSLIVIFILSSVLTNFNFDISKVDTTLGVYDEWKYNHFFLYGFIICSIQFFISLFYANISFCCCQKNKNKLVAIVMSYVVFLIVDIFIYVVIYAIILNNILGIHELTDYFNIAGYWWFDGGTNCLIPLLVSFLLQGISFVVVWKIFKQKSQVIASYEKQVS